MHISSNQSVVIMHMYEIDILQIVIIIVTGKLNFHQSKKEKENFLRSIRSEMKNNKLNQIA